MLGPFESALANRSDISSTFFLDFGTGDLNELVEKDRGVISRVRSLIEKDIRKIDEFLDYEDEVTELLETGQVAAVDGTNAIEPVSLFTTTRMAAACGWMTRKEKSDPHIEITSTVIDWSSGGKLESAKSLSELADLMDYHRVTDSSWPNTFREWQERSMAIRVPSPIVLIDGPIVTQNLTTQSKGREVIETLFIEKRPIGVIKNLSGSWRQCVWAAAALNPGEWYIVGTVGDQLSERYSDNKPVAEWARKKCNTVVRGVYCPRERPFGFECTEADLPIAIEILRQDASSQRGHEIPDLLNQVDTFVRGLFRDSDAMKRRMVAKLLQADREMQFLLGDERDAR